MWLVTKMGRWEDLQLRDEYGEVCAASTNPMGDGSVGFMPVYDTEKAALLASEDGKYDIIPWQVRLNKRALGMWKAMTLIELLVVIAIIALLAAILFPVFRGARERAREVACMSCVHQISVAQQMYTQDYDSFLPIGAYNSQSPTPTHSWDTSWHDLLLPYARDTKEAFLCPSLPAGMGYRWSYGASPWMLPYYTSISEAQVGDGEKLWMAEHETLDWDSLPRDYYDDDQHSYLKARHNGRLVVLHLDGHVRSVAPQSLSYRSLWVP